MASNSSIGGYRDSRPATTAGRTSARGYTSAHDVEVRAANTRYAESDQTRSALDRLARHLATGEEPRANVPPGYYLDVKV